MVDSDPQGIAHHLEKDFFMFTPFFWGDDPILTFAYFFRWDGERPPTSYTTTFPFPYPTHARLESPGRSETFRASSPSSELRCWTSCVGNETTRLTNAFSHGFCLATHVCCLVEVVGNQPKKHLRIIESWIFPIIGYGNQQKNTWQLLAIVILNVCVCVCCQLSFHPLCFVAQFHKFDRLWRLNPFAEKIFVELCKQSHWTQVPSLVLCFKLVGRMIFLFQRWDLC